MSERESLHVKCAAECVESLRPQNCCTERVRTCTEEEREEGEEEFVRVFNERGREEEDDDESEEDVIVWCVSGICWKSNHD